MNANALADRIKNTRRRQTQVLHGAAKAPDGPEPAAPAQHVAQVVANAAEASNDNAGGAQLGHEELFEEFCALLPAAAKLYAYRKEDADVIKDAVRADRAGATRELQLLVRQWRVDIVAAGLDTSGLIEDWAAERARVQFRCQVMGVSHDESGALYSDEQRHWVLAGFGLRAAPVSPRQPQGQAKPARAARP
jgi:hypothetical protein